MVQWSLSLGLPPSLPDATIWYSMTPANSQPSTTHRPRVGIPWRTSDEEDQARTAGPNWKPGRTEDYRKAVESAGGEAVFVPLKDQKERDRLIPTLDAFVLPGSSADIDPLEYHGKNTGKSAEADKHREGADRAILKFALAEKKPVLAICYGLQMLNVYQGGNLIQDIPEALPNRPHAVPHGTTDLSAGAKGGDQYHDAVLTAGSILAKLVESSAVHINSRHHQAIDKLGENLRVTAQAPDGVIEAVEWTGDSNWIVGVQWHPERMPLEHTFSKRLFEELLVAARAREAVAHKT
jgi:putative glutamine amidotransferase